ncbi:MAG: hypothetical protein AAB506_02805 [Patescibacteria group bacterium]
MPAVRVLAISVVSGFLLLAIALPVFADDILSNLDFEDWDSSGPASWQKSAASNFSVTMSSDSGQTKSGTRSALLNVNTSTYRYIYVTGNVSPSTPYRFSGFLRGVSGSFNAVLRLAWYAEGSTSQLSTDDSNSLSGTSDNFSEVAVEVTSPATAKTVKARVVLTPASGSTANSLLVDNLSFSQVAASSQNSQDSQVVAPAPTPKIDWALEDKIYVAKEFKTTKLELSNFDINTEYLLKLRAGTEEGKLTKLQTKNGSAFLSDGETWSKFPLIKTDENAKWAGEIKGFLGEDKPDGKYKIQLRIRKKDTDTYLVSDMKEITFLPETKAVILPLPPPATKPAVLAATSVSAQINLATPTPLSTPSVSFKKATPTNFYLSEIFIISGATLILLAIIALWKLSPELFAKLKIWGKN